MAADTIPVSRSGLTFEDLYLREGLVKLDRIFLAGLEQADVQLHQRLARARAEPSALARKQESELLLALVPHLEQFIASLFGIEAEAGKLAARHNELAPLYHVKRHFVQRKAMHRFKPDEAGTFNGTELERELEHVFGEAFSEIAFARHVAEWQKNEGAHAAELDCLIKPHDSSAGSGSATAAEPRPPARGKPGRPDSVASRALDG